MYLIDTNVLSELSRKSPDPGVVAWFERQDAIVVSAITLEEITFGIQRLKPEQAGRLRQWFESFRNIPPEVVPADARVALLAGQLRAARELSGRIVTQADMLIAATALATERIPCDP